MREVPENNADEDANKPQEELYGSPHQASSGWSGLPNLPKKPDFRTFVTEQRTLLFMQIAVLLGLLVQSIMFVALLFYGRPPEGQWTLIHHFFLVSAVWALTIDAGVVLFWWVTKQGRLQAARGPAESQTNE